MNKILREIKETPNSLVENGVLNVGIFKDYFKEFNFLNKKRPLLRKFWNKNLLTEWQAIEVLAEDIFMICAVFKFGIMNKTLFFVYEISENILHNYSSTSIIKTKANVAPFLVNKSESTRKTAKSFVKIVNNLNDNELFIEGYGDLKENVNFNISFKRIASPSIVSVPMTKKHTVYTEKDLLEPSGYIEFKGKKHILSKKEISILDDHRGYYPLSSGYDWITCMGEITLNNKLSKFGINLTSFYKNEEPNNINENGYWFDGDYFQLPAVTFHREGNVWNISDKQKRIKLLFTQKNCFIEKKNVGFKIDYTLAFGILTGEIVTFDNKTIYIENMFSLGERRLTQLFKGSTHNNL